MGIDFLDSLRIIQNNKYVMKDNELLQQSVVSVSNDVNANLKQLI